MSYSTLQSRDCPRAESLADQRRCRDVAERFSSRLEPRTCPNAAPATVCASVRASEATKTDSASPTVATASPAHLTAPWRAARGGAASQATLAGPTAASSLKHRLMLLAKRIFDGKRGVPELHPSTFCSDDDIPRNFEYSDGCSRYRCNFMSYSTLQSRDCPRAESLADQRRCRDVARAIFNRLEPRTCPNAAPATVCASVRGVGSDQDGFRFTDGCNRFACAPDGSVAGSTWRSCIAGNARRAYCSFIVEAQIDASGESLNRSSVEDFLTANVECPELHPSTFCSDDDIPRNFEYSDGCSRYRCNFMSYSTLQSRDCPRAESLADQRRCRDVARAIFSRLEPRTCPNAAPATVCASVKGVGSDQDGFRFTDGCNRFACAPDGSVAGSTWRSCIAGNARRAYCSFIERDQQVDGMEVGPLFRRRRRTSEKLH
uniref:Thyroglobulin type-1 domain-containing protein n=1 Tax=Macrostomum lignano TaxID=282301 RepID=A0A1I8HYL8_9PLAT